MGCTVAQLLSLLYLSFLKMKFQIMHVLRLCIAISDVLFICTTGQDSISLIVFGTN